MHYNYPLWTQLPYAGQNHPPRNPVNPYAGSWNLHYLDRGRYGFTTLDGEPIKLKLKDPRTIDWRRELKQVQHTISHLTNDQIMIAKFWAEGPPSKQWTPIADILIDTYNVTPPYAARILEALSAGMNDALVITWFLKYKLLVPRPNQLDPELATIVCTPNFPAYPSGHSVLSGTAEVILSYFFPTESKRLYQLAEEDALSRLYAGVHFNVDNTEGLRLGRQIGQIVIDQLRRERDSRGNYIDIPYTEQRNAKLLPPPYVQAIPYDFDTRCSSLVVNPLSNKHSKNHKNKKY